MKSRVKYLFYILAVLCAVFLGASIRNGDTHSIIVFSLMLALSLCSFYGISEFEK